MKFRYFEDRYYAPIHHSIAIETDEFDERPILDQMSNWCIKTFGEPKHKKHRTRWQGHRRSPYVLFLRFRDLADATLFKMRWQ